MTNLDSQVYLSRLILDSNCRQVWSELAHPYEMHRTLMRAFPQLPPEERVKARHKFGVLFRADLDEPRQRVIVYLQSHVKPDWSFLEKCPGYLCADADPPNPASPKDVASAYRRLQAGQVLSFRLRANPTKRVWNSRPGTTVSRGQRIALRTEKEQIEWLVRKSQERISQNGKDKESPGFELVMMELKDDAGQVHRVPRISIRVEGMQTHRKKEDGSGEISHLAVRFDGLLRITDPVRFKDTLIRGIGPAKAFGFGLLSVARVD